MKLKLILGIGLLVYASPVSPALAGSWGDASRAASLNEMRTRLYAAEERATREVREAELELYEETYSAHSHDEHLSPTGHWPNKDVDAWLRMVKANEARREEQRAMNAKWEKLVRQAKEFNK